MLKMQLVDAIQSSDLAATLLANPMMAICIVIVAIIVGKVAKVTGKVIKIILCLGIAYVLVNFVFAGSM